MAKIKSAIFKSNMVIIYSHLVFALCLVYSNKASEIRRPRGVSISKASLYIPENDFTCFDNSLTIPYKYINDDYCDCADGSDEPGTAACPGSFFHCTNAGHRPLNIPSSKVNDGICECCDGSDEYSGKITCENICNEMGRVARQEAQKQLEISKQGDEIRQELSKKGKQLKQEKRDQLTQLEKDKFEAENTKNEKEAAKKHAEELESIALQHYRKEEDERKEKLKDEERKIEEQEALDVFNQLDSNQDKKIQISELEVRQMFDQNKDGVLSDEEIKFFLDDATEVDWDLFLSTVWPKMKPFYMMERGLFQPPSRHEDEQQQQHGVGTVEDVTNEYLHENKQQAQNEEEETEASRDQSENGEEEEVEEGEEDEEEEEEEEEEQLETDENKTEQNIESNVPSYDPETQDIVDAANKARGEFDEADRELRDIQREITQISDSLEKDYGPEEEFAPLEGECFEYIDREYKYKLCPFDQASQQPRSGGSETRLGVWNRWVGPDTDKYQAMLYDKGQSCWNGPQRSALVRLSCGVENAITHVSEPSKCEYRFEFTTPAVCYSQIEQEDRHHDEL